jgi:phosphatidylserine/phosphatidylglycerophosphate/cardiolipin synthase-like enzyme
MIARKLRPALVAITFALLSKALPAGTLDRMAPLQMPQGFAVFFNPGDNIQAKVKAAIGAAKTEILVNEYAITDPDIAMALVDAFKRNHVFVGLILEGKPAVKNYQAPEYFLENDLPVLLVQDEGYNNNKYILIDRQTVLTGSYDLTKAAASRNRENLLITSEASIAVAYYNNWVSTAAAAHPAFLKKSAP